MSKVFITGASGMLGRYVVQQVVGAGHDVIAPTHAEMDLMQPQNIYAFLRKTSPDAILHLAAETDVDLCERDPRRAGICNHLATEAVARAAKDMGAWVLYISTAHVFGDDSKTVYNELDVPWPLSYYGRAKWLGEKELARHCPSHSMVLRAGIMIGGGVEYDHKFVGQIVKQIKAGAETIRAVGDRFGTISCAKSLAKFIVSSLQVRREGTFHYASKGNASRYDIAQAIAEYTGFRGRVVSVGASEFPASAPRPTFEGLESIYLSQEETPNFWKNDVREYLTEFGY